MRLRLRRSRHFYSSSKPKTFRPNRKLPRKNCQVSTICGFVIFCDIFMHLALEQSWHYDTRTLRKQNFFLYFFVLFLCSSKLLSAHFSLLHEDNTTAPFQEKLHKTFPKSKPSNGKKKNFYFTIRIFALDCIVLLTPEFCMTKFFSPIRQNVIFDLRIHREICVFYRASSVQVSARWQIIPECIRTPTTLVHTQQCSTI